MGEEEGLLEEIADAIRAKKDEFRKCYLSDTKRNRDLFDLARGMNLALEVVARKIEELKGRK